MKVFKNETAKNNILCTYNQILEMWNVNKDEKDIPTTYGTTHVIVCGNENNPPLILFHGVGDNSAIMWVYNAAVLSGHFRIYAIDTIGGPGKSCPNKNYNKDFDDAKWIDEVLEGLMLDKVYAAGVSNGAYLAQYYGVHRPERLIKILCMASAIPDDNFQPMKTMFKVFLPEALFPTKNNTIKLLRKLGGKIGDVFTENPTIFEHYQQLLKGFNNMAMGFHNIRRFSNEEIESIHKKTCYLVGEDDPFIKYGGKKALIENKMDTTFFPNVGHGINHEIADEINEAIVEYFLRK